MITNYFKSLNKTLLDEIVDEEITIGVEVNQIQLKEEAPQQVGEVDRVEMPQ